MTGTVDAKNYIGKKMRWNDVVELFPDCWIALTDYGYDETGEREGVLEAVCTEQHMVDAMKKIRKEKGKVKIAWYRTTFLPGNVLWLD